MAMNRKKAKFLLMALASSSTYSPAALSPSVSGALLLQGGGFLLQQGGGFLLLQSGT